MATIVLATLNARYQHCAFGLRYIHANLGELRAETTLLEFTIQQSPLEIVEAILAQTPRIVALSIYIWNITETERVVATLKRLRPDLCVVLGGPEVSYETDEQPICRLADVVICGEGDLAFPEFCREWLGQDVPTRLPVATPRVIHAPVPDLNRVALPYDLYSDDDLAQRVVYVEASRGCPFTCEFCLSALDIPVRQFPLENFLAAMQQLFDRGCRTFKFVDRTFNLNLRVSRAILEFFLERQTPDLFLHFEMIPDRLPENLRSLIARFPAGMLQFEVGIQTFNPVVCDLISRKQNNTLAEQNLQWLRTNSGVHVHADLIVGLPGESIASFAGGFDRLVKLQPQEIQVGILKRLRGTPIIRHDAAYGMVYSAHPPYEILQTADVSFGEMQLMRRFARTWDLIANSGNFVETTRQLLDETPSPFVLFLRWSDWLQGEAGRTHAIALPRLVELAFRFLTEELGLDRQVWAERLHRDYRRAGRSDVPYCLRPFVQSRSEIPPHDARIPVADGDVRSRRQALHHPSTP